MPQLELTELEAKALWLILDRWNQNPDHGLPESWPFAISEVTLFDKVYRAYRGMPQRRPA